MANTYPQLIAFDLDYTLWDLWIDTHVSGPLRRNKDTLNEILDRYDQPITFYHEVPSVLHRIKFADVKIAACSRTSAPELAKEALNLLLVAHSKAEPNEPPKRAIEYFDELEIYPGSKIKHFKELHRKTNIPFSQMLFFDDERRNKEVEKLGVTFILVPDGLDEKLFEAGLAEWRRRHLVPEPEEPEPEEPLNENTEESSKTMLEDLDACTELRAFNNLILAYSIHPPRGTSLKMQLPIRHDFDTPISSGCSSLALTNKSKDTPHRTMVNDASMSLEPGVYVVRNLKSDSVIDLSGGDSKSIIGFPRHGLENQQASNSGIGDLFAWEFGFLGDGWYIRSVHTGNYLTIEKGLGDGFPVVANGYPVAWAIENESEEGNDVFRVLWPNTPFSFDLDNGSPTPGAKVNLWSRRSGAHHQLWQLQRCPDKDQKNSEVATISEMVTPDTTTTTTTTTTVTTTTVTTRRNGVPVAE